MWSVSRANDCGRVWRLHASSLKLVAVHTRRWRRTLLEMAFQSWLVWERYSRELAGNLWPPDGQMLSCAQFKFGPFVLTTSVRHFFVFATIEESLTWLVFCYVVSRLKVIWVTFSRSSVVFYGVWGTLTDCVMSIRQRRIKGSVKTNSKETWWCRGDHESWQGWLGNTRRFKGKSQE